MTVTVPCVVLPVGSVLSTAIVLSVTLVTRPETGAGDPGAGGSGGAHLPASAGKISTDSAVIAPPGEAPCGAGLTSTQVPGFTSGRAAELISVTIVCGVKSTVAELRSRWVSWIVSPDTDLTKPSISSWPMGGGGGG